MKRTLKHARVLENLTDTISLCMIMKNEAKRLGRCLDSVKTLVSEIIIVDTGSTDGSIKIAEQYGAKVMTSPWCDDFAFSRNVGLMAASMNWIFILDPDEVVSPQDLQRIRELTTQPGIIAYQMTTRNYGDNPMQVDARPNPMDVFEAKQYTSFIPSTKIRLFQNHHGLKFQGCWHELVDYDLLKKKLPWTGSGVPIHHYPEEISQESHKEKAAFYLRIAEKKVRLDPNDLQAWWELAIAENICGYKERALISASMTLRNKVQAPSRLFFISALYGLCGKEDKAKHLFEKAVCLLYPNLTHINPVKKLFAAAVVKK